MAVRMRLRREGKKKQPFYRVVVADARSPRDGRYIEDIGYYQPLNDPSTIEINSERALYWLGNGVQPSDQVKQLLRVTGIWEEFKPGDPGRDRTAKIDLHIQTVHQERKSHLKAYKQCPSCGSKKVKTISKKVAEAAVHRTQPSATAGPPPGWYPPSDGGPPRYWDGQRWTASGP